jgi:hypothetical protein
MTLPEYQTKRALVISWKRLVFVPNQETFNVSKIHSEVSGKTAQNFLLKA